VALRGFRGACLLLGALALSACESAYYGAMEQFGVHKRDILVDRVEEAREAQDEAREQFASALEEFSSVVEYDGGDLEEIYERLNAEFERSEDRAEDVRERVDAVERVSEALFDEWSEELEQYSNASLRRDSERQLRETRARYEELVAAMWRAEGRIAPVLDAFRDQVLYLKHNLNARAIAALRSELGSIESDVRVLLADMEAAIAESDRFIADMRTEG
jgi:DNA repair exonuclease SbcCD ATPase subunit